MSTKILFVDDDPNLLAGVQRTLRRQFALDCAPSGLEALDMVRKIGPYAVVVCDMRMPGMDGVQTLERIRAIHPDTVRIMLTGNADQHTAVEAVNRGQIFRFLNKPCPPEIMIPALETALKQHELQRVERELLEGTLTGSVKAFGDLLAMVAPHVHTQSECLRQAMRVLAPTVEGAVVWECEVAAMLAQIGCASLPPVVIRKLSVRGDLTIEERAMVARVPQVGYNLLKDIPRLDRVASIILYQRKAFDGEGFPGDFCSGEQIPVGARLLRILADRLDLEAMGIVRTHAWDTMKTRRGVYDPTLLESSFRVLPGPVNNRPVGERPPIAISIAEIAPGQCLARDILTSSGLVLVSAGNSLTPMMVERIRNLAELGDVKEPIMVEDKPAPAEGDTP